MPIKTVEFSVTQLFFTMEGLLLKNEVSGKQNFLLFVAASLHCPPVDKDNPNDVCFLFSCFFSVIRKNSCIHLYNFFNQIFSFNKFSPASTKIKIRISPQSLFDSAFSLINEIKKKNGSPIANKVKFQPLKTPELPSFTDLFSVVKEERPKKRLSLHKSPERLMPTPATIAQPSSAMYFFEPSNGIQTFVDIELDGQMGEEQIQVIAPQLRTKRQKKQFLKSWLRKRMNDPYPTQQEKDFLVRITQMSLKQVSTWLANARRRLIPRWQEEERLARHL